MLSDYYRAIEDGNVKMLEAAKAEDWEGVVRIEGACAVLIEKLRNLERGEACSTLPGGELAQPLHRFASNDAQIRGLSEPWLTHFEQKKYARDPIVH